MANEILYNPSIYATDHHDRFALFLFHHNVYFIVVHTIRYKPLVWWYFHIALFFVYNYLLPYTI